MTPPAKMKLINWMGSSKKDLKSFPDEVQDAMGYALHLAQIGQHPRNASLMKGQLQGVTEIRDTDASGTYRTMYTAKLEGTVYILHAFQKKSKSGIATPKQDLELIIKRFEDAKLDHAKQQRKGGLKK